MSGPSEQHFKGPSAVAVLVRWHKRIWSCPEPDCHVRTWTEQVELAEPRRVLTTRAARWAMGRVAAVEGTPASIGRAFGVSWSTVWAAVARHDSEVLTDPGRVGPTRMVGFDETVMQPAHRRRRFVTAVVDVGTGQILDVFEGRDAKDLRNWMGQMPPAWLAQIQVVSVDPHEGYRSAVTNLDPPPLSPLRTRPGSPECSEGNKRASDAVVVSQTLTRMPVEQASTVNSRNHVKLKQPVLVPGC